ncbi:MAG: hypothetical protein FD174_3744 [Geobacteraceae bacterium]|nr:MAG: hypothetical protein FD174_3744 [Geobacteraceae bacterium]
MLEKSCSSMRHFEHMCSLTLNGCAVEQIRSPQEYECSACDEKSHSHNYICTPSLFGT